MDGLGKRIKAFFKKSGKESPALCACVLSEGTEETCGSVMQQIGSEWVCTKDDQHRQPINYSQSRFFPALCAYTINGGTGEICGSKMQQIGDEWVCTKDNQHRYSINR